MHSSMMMTMLLFSRMFRMFVCVNVRQHLTTQQQQQKTHELRYV